MMNNKNGENVLLLCSDCIVVQGPKRAIIVDLTRRIFKFIPLSLSEILVNSKGKTKEQIIREYGKFEADIIDEYFDFLKKNEFIIWCEKKDIECFPEIELDWKYPSIISNIIIDLNNKSNFEITPIINQVEELNCQFIQFRNFSYQSIEFWDKYLNCFIDSKIKSIEIITKWDAKLVHSEIEKLVSKYPRIHSIIFHSSPKMNIIQNRGLMGNIIYLKDKIENNLHCGQFHWNYFNSNITFFTEAQHHNTCLNRKISIDVNGEIKNCPSMTKSYGNIKDTTLVEAIEKPGFKNMWYIKKDQIAVCKDCEFRYICTDCRAFIENPEDIYSKPLKCGYNPYTAEWEEWSTNPIKQKAIEYYGMQELILKGNLKKREVS